MTVFEKYKIENYTINEDGSIDVNGDVHFYEYGLTELPINLIRFVVILIVLIIN